MHGKVGRFIVRDGGQDELLLHRITGSAGSLPQAGIGGADGVQLGVFGVDFLLHPQQHGAQVAVQVIPQGGVTRKICMQRLFHFPDEGSFQIPQLHLLCAAPRVLRAQISSEIQFQILRFLGRQGQSEGAVQGCHQPGSMVARRAKPSGCTAFVAALLQLLNGQGAVDGQRQKACIRQMKLLFLLKLLQDLPDLFGCFRIQQGRKDSVFRHPSAEHLCQFLFRQAAAQQGRHYPPVGRSIPLQPDPHAGAAEHLHPVGVQFGLKFIQVRRQRAFRNAKLPCKCRCFAGLLLTEQPCQKLLPPLCAGKFFLVAAVQPGAQCVPLLRQLIQQQTFAGVAHKMRPGGLHPLLHGRQLPQYGAAADPNAFGQRCRRHPPLRKAEQLLDQLPCICRQFLTIRRAHVASLLFPKVTRCFYCNIVAPRLPAPGAEKKLCVFCHHCPVTKGSMFPSCIPEHQQRCTNRPRILWKCCRINPPVSPSSGDSPTACHH